MNDKERREWIKKRREGSTLWQFIHLAGSLQLAMVLLLTIAIACAVATLYESKFNAQIAQAYVYKAPWFVFWLGVLCINLFCVTLTRWPWQRKHFGFVITHYGIILLLIGAVLGQKLGVEANVNLQVGGKPTRQLVINRTILQVESPVDRVAYKIPFPVEVRPPTPERPRLVALPDTKLKLKVQDYSEKLSEATELVDSPIPGASSGVALAFSSALMGQKVEVNLVRIPEGSNFNDFFGRARIELHETLPDRSAARSEHEAVDETQVVFAKHEPVVSRKGGKASGYRMALILEGAQPALVVESPNQHREMFDIATVLGKPFTLHGETAQIVVREYWPDMVMEEGKPITRSQDPNNPAILVTLTDLGPLQKEKPLLEVAVQEGGRLAYQISRGGVVQSQGNVATGESFPLGWADWEARVAKATGTGVLRNKLTPVEAPTREGEELIPGVLARLVDPKSGAEGEPLWIPSGRGMILRLGEQTTFVGFGLEVHTLPFTIELLKFEVPRDPGTQNPADFRSTVRFHDTATGHTQDSLIHMNHPASYPPGWELSFTGRNFKFSQASWNPKNLDETTLQVLHDPGWFFKWVGSFVICAGIAIMFYFTPKSSGNARRKAEEVEEEA